MKCVSLALQKAQQSIACTELSILSSLKTRMGPASFNSDLLRVGCLKVFPRTFDRVHRQLEANVHKTFHYLGSNTVNLYFTALKSAIPDCAVLFQHQPHQLCPGFPRRSDRRRQES